MTQKVVAIRLALASAKGGKSFLKEDVKRQKFALSPLLIFIHRTVKSMIRMLDQSQSERKRATNPKGTLWPKLILTFLLISLRGLELLTSPINVNGYQLMSMYNC